MNYNLDKISSEKAGYDVFRSEDSYYNYICDLGDRLEVKAFGVKEIFIATNGNIGECTGEVGKCGCIHAEDNLITNNPKKIVGLKGYGLTIHENINLKSEVNKYNERYINTKREKMHHLM